MNQKIRIPWRKRFAFSFHLHRETGGFELRILCGFVYGYACLRYPMWPYFDAMSSQAVIGYIPLRLEEGCTLPGRRLFERVTYAQQAVLVPSRPSNP